MNPTSLTFSFAAASQQPIAFHDSLIATGYTTSALSASTYGTIRSRVISSPVVAAAPDSTTMIGADLASVAVGAMTSYCRVRRPTFIE